jgi:hypothetical protein
LTIGTISEFLIQLHEDIVLLFDVELLIGQSIVHDVVSDPVLEFLTQLVVAADRVCVLDVLLKVVTGLPHGCKDVANLTDDVPSQDGSFIIDAIPRTWMNKMRII